MNSPHLSTNVKIALDIPGSKSDAKTKGCHHKWRRFGVAIIQVRNLSIENSALTEIDQNFAVGGKPAFIVKIIVRNGKIVCCEFHNTLLNYIKAFI